MIPAVTITVGVQGVEVRCEQKREGFDVVGNLERDGELNFR